MSLYDNIIKSLQASSYKLTSQREKILKMLVENKEEHLSAEELYFMLKENNPEIGLATVYRTLDMFYELKILEKITFGNGISKYHIRQKVEPGMHHHLICTACHSIKTVKNPIFNDLIKYVSKAYSFKTQDDTIALYGYCQNCTKEKRD